MARLILIMAGLVLLALVWSCSSDVTPGVGPLPECSGPVNITIGSGTTPMISWLPECRLFFLLVEVGGADKWGVITEGKNDIDPPVKYGDVPRGATEIRAPTPIKLATTYNVVLFRWTGPGAEDGEMIGSQTFTLQ